jgi:hypothetical protein
MKHAKKYISGQTAIEYLLLLGVVVVVVLVGFRKYVPQARNDSELYYNRVATGLMGDKIDPAKLK